MRLGVALLALVALSLAIRQNEVRAGKPIPLHIPVQDVNSTDTFDVPYWLGAFYAVVNEPADWFLPVTIGNGGATYPGEFLYIRNYGPEDIALYTTSPETIEGAASYTISSGTVVEILSGYPNWVVVTPFSASNVTCGAGMSCAGDQVSLATYGSASSCAWANVATDAYGRTTCTANAVPVQSVTAGNQLVQTGSATNPTLGLAATVTVDTLIANLAVSAPAVYGANDLRYWGGKCDDATDNFAAFTNMMVLNGVGIRGQFSVPAGICRILFTTTVGLFLRSGQQIKGQGMGITILNFRPDTATGRQLFNLGFNVNDVSISDFSVSVTLPTSSGQTIQGIRVQSGSNTNFVMERVAMLGGVTSSFSYSYYAFAWSGTGSQTGFAFRDNFFSEMTGIFLKDNTYTSAQYDIVIQNNRAVNIIGGINLNSPSGIQQGIVITGNEFFNSRLAPGILSGTISVAAGRNIIISNNIFRGYHWTAIHIEDDTRNWIIEGNSVQMTCNANFVTCFGISIQDGGSTRQPLDGVIQANVIEMFDSGAASSPRGIALIYDSTSADAAKHVTVAENIVKGFKRGSSVDGGVFMAYQHEGLPANMVSYVENEAQNSDIGFTFVKGSILSKQNRAHNCTTGMFSGDVIAGGNTRFIAESQVFSLCDTAVTGIGVSLADFKVIPDIFSMSSSAIVPIIEIGENTTMAGQMIIAVTGGLPNFAGYYYGTYYVTWNGADFTSFMMNEFAGQYLSCHPELNSSTNVIVECDLTTQPTLTSVRMEVKFSGLYSRSTYDAPIASQPWTPFNVQLQCTGATCTCEGGTCQITVPEVEHLKSRLDALEKLLYGE